MRTTFRFSTLAVVLIAVTALTGCRHLEREIEYHFGPQHAARSVEAPSPHAKIRRAKSSVVHRVVSPRTVTAGSKIRRFCAQRHILFQRGQLRETPSEAARNNVLCSQS
jgi:hypothetical protein